jgi:hypothetical protein
MLPMSPVRLRRRALPVAFGALSALAAACSDPSAPLAPRIGGTAHPVMGVTYFVTNTDDAGPGSLREAIITAADGDMIRFAPAIAGQTIELSTGAIVVDKPLTIEGPVPKGITVSGGFRSRVFNIDEPATLRNLTIVNGRADDGGGIRATVGFTLENSLVANNEGTIGPGGIDSEGSNLVVINSTVTGNIGGGIGLSGSATIRNVTITGNSGGGLLLGTAGVILRNSIIANNTNDGSTPPRSNCYATGQPNVTFVGVNVSNDASCGTDPALVVADPKLGPLAANGGPTRTHALLLGSPAIDAGSLCTEATDQRYVARDKGLSCDAGAFEFENFAALGLTVGPNVALNPKTGVVTVSGTISCAAPTTVALNVALSQTQKVTGRFTTIVQAAGATSVNCTGTSAWSAALVPSTGNFAVGSASATAGTANVTGGFLPATAAAPVKVFVAK